MMSPADILSTQAAASLQRDSLKYDLVGSPTKRDDIGTVYPAYSTKITYNMYIIVVYKIGQSTFEPVLHATSTTGLTKQMKSLDFQ